MSSQSRGRTSSRTSTSGPRRQPRSHPINRMTSSMRRPTNSRRRQRRISHRRLNITNRVHGSSHHNRYQNSLRAIRLNHVHTLNRTIRNRHGQAQIVIIPRPMTTTSLNSNHTRMQRRGYSRSTPRDRDRCQFLLFKIL